MVSFASMESPLGADLKLLRLQAQEAISEPFTFSITALSRRPDIDFKKLLGERVTVTLHTGTVPPTAPRVFDGLVQQVSLVGQFGRHFHYLLQVRPWFWFLSHTQDLKVFQNQTVLQIIDEVLADHPIALVDKRTTATYTPWVYCVQYRESDFAFLSRLMEQEGIAYHFEHQLAGGKGRHTLVLTDGTAGHTACAGCHGGDALPVRTGDVSGVETQACVWSLCSTQQVTPGAAVMQDYDFSRPHMSLQQATRTPQPHALGDMEVYDYPGGYDVEGDGEQFARSQMEEYGAATVNTSGQTSARTLACGGLVQLQRSLRPTDNAEFLVTGTQIELQQPEAEGGVELGEAFRCSFSLQPSDVPFRPRRSTPKPFVQGPQTAVVVGPAGEEIHTDNYGRIKVQFHWDRYGQKNEKSSCWVRVASPWAGKNFGFVQVPRIGQEVIVDFLEGDPDQPIVTGRVYNAQNMPPWELPANATQSGVLTRSSKGGAYGNANAIRFEDKAGSEQLWIHAEKNQDNEVENDETTDIGRDRTEHVGRNETVTIDGMHVETVKKAKAETIFLAKALSIGLGYQTTVGAAMNTTVALGQFAQVGHSKNTLVGQHYSITAGDSFSVTVGKARLTMTSDGKVTIVGSQFLFDASGPVQINGKDIDLN